MMHGRNNGKKLMAVHIVKKAMETIHVLTDKKKILFKLLWPTRKPLWKKRLANSIMMHRRNNGKNLMAVHIVKKAMETIHVLTDKKKNPIQVIVDAIINSGPREDATHIGSSAVVKRQAVDISPLKRVDLALYLLTKGARECAFRNMKSMAECLKKDEIDHAAKANR
uniref:Small ribosomal subunit protein uS7 domain-containing protein n=1 Tax=Nelumbo nucifera TaxID=4432 RepID=A0A822XXR7_NELNU|nr:TPA_asm: hypothetical protein HUJ06_025259 [Nelumbo nucifera]